MHGICATNVPYRKEQPERLLRTGAPAVSILSAKRMKIQFSLPRTGSAEGRPQSNPLAGNGTARRPLTRFASAFKPQNPVHRGLGAEHRICYLASRATHLRCSATEPNKLESFQPSMLCNRSLPIYFSDDRAVPQIQKNKCED
jgi:hypothetical protein